MSIQPVISPLLDSVTRAGSELTKRSAEDAELQSVRSRGASQLRKLGLPASGNEQWKYTNISPLTRSRFVPSTDRQPAALPAEAAARCILPGGEAARLVFVDGVFCAEHSSMTQRSGSSAADSATAFGLVSPLASLMAAGDPDSDSVRKAVLSRLLERAAEEDGFIALNSSLLGEGAVISVRAGKTAPLPIHVVSVVTGRVDSLLNPLRNVILAGENAEVEVVESYLSLTDSPYFTSVVTDVAAAASSRVTVTKIVCEGSQAFHVGRLSAEIDRQATFTSNVFSFGGKLVRNEICPVLLGEHIECHMNGLTAIRDEQHVDNDTLLDHAVPNCFSREHYKGIYGERSSGVFGGTIIVRPHAQKTNAIQSNQTLLLSDQATIDTRPQLKIWADDVKCTHGATVGQLDEDALFYIRSRGIAEESARALLIQAFAGDVVQYLRSPELRTRIEELLSERLHELLGAETELAPVGNETR